MKTQIAATPTLKGPDLVNFVTSLAKMDSKESKTRRGNALSLLKSVKR
jgi:hypothetical protein